MKRARLINSEFYHVYNRGVEKRDIFLDDKDHFRFVHSLWECNNARQVLNIGSRFKHLGVRADYGGPSSIVEREPLVDIVAWCLMPNHFHLLLRQRTDNGISLFMKKIGTAHAMYFNIRHKRNGILFQGRFKAVHVDNNRYLQHLINYIHLNPVDLVEPKWKESGISDKTSVQNFLHKYRWSSYLDYLHYGGRSSIVKKNFPSVINLALAEDLFGTLEHHEKSALEWLPEDTLSLQPLTLE